MPKITGKLKTITDSPSSVREVWLRPPATRPSGTGLIVDEPVRVIVDESGEFTANIAPGAGVLLLIGPAGMTREAIPLLVHEGTATVRQAVEDAKDFAPDVHDRLAELANVVARGVESVGGGAAAVLADRERVEAAVKATKVSQAAAESSEKQAVSAWEQLKARLLEWEPRAQQLEKWQPHYEWLKENSEKSFAVVQEKITQATDALMAQVRGDAESAKRDAATAGQHSLKAQAASKTAESAAQSAVDTAVKKLLDGAPQAYDTLKEVADELASQKSAAAALMRQISEKAQASDLAALRLRVESLAISGVSGLSQALAGKANLSHQHRVRDITDLDSVMSSKADKKHTHSARDVVDFTAAAGRVVASAIGDRMGSLRIKTGTGSDPNTIYFEV
ncbi:phage tail fiber repeat family protein [Corynebacterium rouxii]|uniref:Uncharacterized protein n=1 Tax=Corynebacterium rouxii TaxID=2719119 RepID=A0A6I8MHL6_9CORY|nr:hypothetical protein [Corynebacterium rouxii]VZH85302.1 hypothetical protein FRC0190_01269 [Corynebacterium rouxii]